VTGTKTLAGMASGLAVALLAMGCTGRITGAGATPTSNPGAGSGGGATGGAGGTTSAASPVESPSPRLLRQLTVAEYASTTADLLHLPNIDTSAIPPDVAVDGFTTNVLAAFVSDTSMDAYNSTAGTLGDRAVAESFAALVPCTTADATCASTFVDQFGLRAFRRPLTADEHTRYAALFDATLTGGDFKTGVGLVIKSMLVSPYFLFRSELGADMGNGTFKLTPFETATALSYTYWGTMPDEALLAAAQSGALASKAQLETQARRLLADPRGRARVASFFYEWMDSPRAYDTTKDMGTYPNFFSQPGGTDALVDAMRAEEDAFVANVVFDSTKKFDELFSAGYVYVNDLLAKYYGLTPPGSTTPQKVTLPAGAARGGLLTLGMFLVGHARTNESSPTQRGHMIRANILCSDVPPPPPNINTNITTTAAGQTGRDQIQALTGSGVCATCHNLMNPIGFGLESFDSTGAQRTLDNGQPVDTTGVINGFTSSTGAPLTFDGPRELSNLLAQSQDARRCFAANFHRYARGYAAMGVDLGAVQLLQQDFLANNLDLPELFIRVALQDSFVLRRSAEVVAR
jgi:Protein of unknown function (DUF1592)/Protein of unknown function (DUF1588)/Protein of unknown function (DUF1595)/Protein of unknown function (DUF1587)/Protein of unknown function (DUF1585)